MADGWVKALTSDIDEGFASPSPPGPTEHRATVARRIPLPLPGDDPDGSAAAGREPWGLVGWDRTGKQLAARKRQGTPGHAQGVARRGVESTRLS